MRFEFKMHLSLQICKYFIDLLVDSDLRDSALLCPLVLLICIVVQLMLMQHGHLIVEILIMPMLPVRQMQMDMEISSMHRQADIIQCAQKI